VQEPEVVIARLGAAFADQDHDLVVEGEIKAAPDRRTWVEQLLQAGFDRISPADLDLLVFRAISTVGGVPTFKFALSRFLGVMIMAPRYGDRSSSDSYVILPKLDHAQFWEWPVEQRRAIVDALELWADRRLLAEPADREAEDIQAWVNAHRVV
jgi:hypothetical protein